MTTDMDLQRNPKLTADQVKAFKAVIARIKRHGLKCVKESVIRRELESHPALLKRYLQHASEFDVLNQERWEIFSGVKGVCQAEGCGNYTSYKRGRGYAKYCCASCAGKATVDARKATCLKKYGAEGPRKALVIEVAVSQAAKRAYTEDYRSFGLASHYTEAFVRILNSIRATGVVRQSYVIEALAQHKKLLHLYLEHCTIVKHITVQERWEIFSGVKGVCQAEGCGNYTSYKRGRGYAKYCGASCAGSASNKARKATCRKRYGVDYVSQVPEVTEKRASAIRKSYADKGRAAPRKGRYDYVPPKVRPNTGNAFYAYVLLDPRKPGLYKYGRFTFDHEPFYVGKGKGGRAFSHVRTFDIEKISNPHKKNKIRAILRAELDPIVKIQKTELSELEAFELEARLIKSIGCGQDGPLTNQQRSVDGRAGYKHTKQTRHLLSEISKATWAAHQKDEYAARCCAISSAKAGYTLSEYRALLKTLPYGTVRIVIDAENFRMSRRAEHQCRCGHSWSVSPNYMVLQNVGCPACKADDCNALSEKTKKIVAAKARTSYPAYIEYLKSEYGTEITVLADPSTFRMNYEQLHRCCHGHEWKISPKLLKRYRNGCPYCMTHTKRTAKQVLLNIGHI